MEQFFKYLYAIRVILIGVFVIILIFSSFKIFGHVFDIEFRGPEWDRLNEATRDKENQEAAERVREGSTNERDREKASDFYRDHEV